MKEEEKVFNVFDFAVKMAAGLLALQEENRNYRLVSLIIENPKYEKIREPAIIAYQNGLDYEEIKSLLYTYEVNLK